MRKKTWLLAALLGVAMLTPTVSNATTVDFGSLAGNPGSCGALTSITGGCRMFIAATYTDFTISDLSSTNRARVDFVQGNIDKLLLTGARIDTLPSFTGSVVLVFSHQFSDFNTGTGGGGGATINNTASFAASTPSGTVPELLGLGEVALCAPGPVCPPTHLFSPTIDAFPNFNLSDNEPVPNSATNTLTFLKGTITINGLLANQRVSTLNLTLNSGANLPSIQGGGACTDQPGFPCFDLDGPGPNPPINTPQEIIDNFQTVPEPSTMLLLGTGMAAMWVLRRRHSSNREAK